jgi:hypothetical protein
LKLRVGVIVPGDSPETKEVWIDKEVVADERATG